MASNGEELDEDQGNPKIVRASRFTPPAKLYTTGEMPLSIYQTQAMRHVMKGADTYERQVLLGAMGVSREASEVAEIVERWLFFGQGLDVEKIKDELGDVLWYMALLCETTGLTLGEVVDHNVEKLNRRYPGGKYSQEAWEADRKARGVE